MFKFLLEIDERLYNRYLTLEKNIKAGSNSFYDSYLDLQEQFVKNVAVFCDFDIKEKETCGELLRRQDIRNFFKDILKVDDFTYTKMQDYTLKVNAHKHKGEKHIQIETIVSYMRIIYDATVAFAVYRQIPVSVFEADYFIAIFGEFEKENSALKAEMVKLKEELLVSAETGKLKDRDIVAYKSLLSQSEIDMLDLEAQNQELHRQISKLKDIKLSSMEEKLNKTIDLLNELTASVVENRAISYAVGDTIVGRERFEQYVDKAKAAIPKVSSAIGTINGVLSDSVDVIKGVNDVVNIFTKGKK